jgi:tripartite-type tricarboxylate transporter receptor subunit TctC
LAFGTSGKGTVGHLSGEWLKKRAGVELLHIPYNGTPAALQAVLSDEAQVMFGPESAEHIAAGTLKGIAVLGDKRWDKLAGAADDGRGRHRRMGTAAAGTLCRSRRSAPEEVKQQLNKT